MRETDLEAVSTTASLLLLEELIRHGPMARTDLAVLRGESLPQMSKLCKQLIDAGLVVETAASPDGRGRPRRPLAVQAGALAFAGVGLTSTDVTGVVIGLDNEVVASTRRALPDTDSSRVVDAVSAALDDLIKVAGRPNALGICLDATIAGHRTVTATREFGWRSEVRLAELVGAATGLATVVENDVAALAVAQRWFGTRRGSDNFAVLVIGDYIGLSAIVAGHRLATAGSGLGPLEHQLLDPNGPPCELGHPGCADTLTTTSLVRRAGHALSRQVDVADALRAGDDPRVRPILDQAGALLGTLIATTANFLQPDHIVVAGEGAALADVARSAMEKGIAAHRNPALARVTVDVLAMGPFSAAHAAAVTALDSCLHRAE